MVDYLLYSTYVIEPRLRFVCGLGPVVRCLWRLHHAFFFPTLPVVPSKFGHFGVDNLTIY